MALFPELKEEFHQNLRDLGLDDDDIAQQLPYMFEEYWARPNQKEPEYPYYIWMLLAGRGFGKGLALDTKVPTPNGFTTMGELKVGDVIYGGNGKPARVTALSNINNIDCYKIIFDDGSEIIADGEHRWSVTTRITRKIGSNKSKEPEVVLVNTRQLYLEQIADDGRINFAIETADIYSKTWDRINPFLFGVYLGCCDANETRIENPELLAKVKKEMGNFLGCDIVDNVPVGLRAELKRVGALGEKCIPEHIFFASNNYKTKIVEGLLASGALIVKRNNLLYNTKNSRLKRDLSILLASMGYKVHKNKNGITWCWLKKNANKRVNKRFIKSVEKHPTVSTICISVDSSDKTYLVTENFIRTHNTRTGAEWVRKRVEEQGAKRIALVSRNPSDAVKVMIYGEALCLETPILTTNGMKKLRDVHAGDYVYGRDGMPTRVLWESPVYSNRECYEIEFITGDKIIADASHKWAVEQYKDRVSKKARKDRSLCKESILTTKEIADTLKYRSDVYNHVVRLSDCVHFDEQDLSINPYVLGVWLGDGAKREGTIACVSHKDIIDKLGQFHDINEHSCGKQYCLVGLFPLLKLLGLINNKHIPNAYIFSSMEQRIELIRGLMDSDGTIGKTGDCSFTNTNLEIVKALRLVLCSLGVKVGKIMQTNARGNNKVKYRIVFHSAEFCPFSAISKCKKWSARNNHGVRIKHRAIVSVKKIKSVPVKCISVDNNDKMYLAGESMIPTHNSGIMRCSPPWRKPKYNQVKKKLTWPCECHGSYDCDDCPIAYVFSSYLPDEIRGNQFDTAWGDEFASWFKLEDTWMQLNMATRLGDPKILLSTTPRPIKAIKELASKAVNKEMVIDTVTGLETDVRYAAITSGSTYDNKANLPNTYIQKMRNDYEGTKIGQQELYGEVLEDLSGTYWSQSNIDAFRIDPEDLEYRDEAGNLLDLSPEAKKLKFIDKNIEKIAIGVDPGFSDGKDAGETGIVVAGIDSDGEAYILEDGSAQMSPSAWAKKISKLYHKYLADVVIAETNHGQKIVLTNISVHDPTIRIRGVHAKKGKKTRAQPISTLYERGKVHHLGSKKDFEKLEEQMTTWTEEGKSPDRIDALVWVLTYLLVDALYYGQIESAIIEREDDDEMSTEALKDIGLFGSVSGSMWDNGDSDLGSFTMWD